MSGLYTVVDGVRLPWVSISGKRYKPARGTYGAVYVHMGIHRRLVSSVHKNKYARDLNNRKYYLWLTPQKYRALAGDRYHANERAFLFPYVRVM